MNTNFLIRILTGSIVLSILLVDSVPINEKSSNDFTFNDFVECGFNNSPLNCAKAKVGRILDNWDDELHDQMVTWGEEADKEVRTSGRQLNDMEEKPSNAAHKLQIALNELATILQKSIYRTFMKKEGDSEDVVEIITEASEDDEKVKDKKKRKKTHPGNPYSKKGEEHDMTSSEVQHRDEETMIEVGENMSVDADMAGPNKLRVKRENETEEGRGKKKKQKKAILKLLLLGAVLKAKIGLLLQLLTAHLQVKFFAIALAGLALNIARFWLDLKKGHAPQKVIYYEHAQHQHHYEHDDDGSWGGYWSRSIDTKADNKKGGGTPDAGDSDDLAYGGWGRSQKY